MLHDVTDKNVIRNLTYLQKLMKLDDHSYVSWICFLVDRSYIAGLFLLTWYNSGNSACRDCCKGGLP